MRNIFGCVLFPRVEKVGNFTLLELNQLVVLLVARVDFTAG